jgi:hypothetical protein
VTRAKDDIQARLTPEAQGRNDIYWCEHEKVPVVHQDGERCSACHMVLDAVPWCDYHKFLAHVYDGNECNELRVLAAVVKGTDDAEAEIEILREAISQFAQQVHQAYHGAHPPDLCDVNHHECPRGLCRSVQHVLNPERPRGMP